MSRIKKFGKKYWLPITVGVVCITVTYIVTRRVTLRSLPVEEVSIDFFNEPTKKLVEVLVPEVINGMKGNSVFNPDTRVGYFSQRIAAQALEVDETLVSGHLHGGIPDVQGRILERTNFRIFAEVEK